MNNERKTQGLVIQPTRILLIGDCSDLGSEPAAPLRKIGYEVDEALAGREGLRLAREKKPGLVLLNVALPDLNGLLICKEIKSDPALVGTFVVLISKTSVSWEERSAGVAVGADEYLAKPVMPRDLVLWVQAMVRVQQAERERRAGEQRFRALVERSSDAIAVTNAEGIFSYVSPSTTRMLGYASEELLGHSAFDLVHPSDLPAVLDQFRRLQESPGGSESGEFRYRHKDGSWRWLEGIGTNLLADPAVRGVVGNYRDISERVMAQQASRASAEKLQMLSSRLIETQETERRHLAREIHDEIGQALIVLELNLQSMLQKPAAAEVAPQVKESVALVEKLIEQVHGIALDLRPSMLDDLGLVPALRWYANHQAQRANLRTVFFADSLQTRLDAAIETACYRVGQEAVINVVRHARARELTVQLVPEDEHLHLLVQDDGDGFELAAVQEAGATPPRLGLLGMKERVSLVGGRIEIKSAPGRGTEVHAWFPFNYSDRADDPVLSPPSSLP